LSAINFECYLCDLPGLEYQRSTFVCPKGGVMQYPGDRLHLDPDPLPGIPPSQAPGHCSRRVLDMVFDFGNDQGAQLLGRSLSVGDVVCVWRNPYGRRYHYAIDRHGFRLVDSAPFEALVRAANLLASSRQETATAAG
jgi:hypothetical protein